MKITVDEKNEIWQGRCDLGNFSIVHSDEGYECTYNIGNIGDWITKDTLEEAFAWCYDEMLKCAMFSLQSLAPEGQRVDLTNWKYVCGATLEGVGWNCSLEPGHTGDHYCEWKGVYWK